jgi:hypothetical protein
MAKSTSRARRAPAAPPEQAAPVDVEPAPAGFLDRLRSRPVDVDQVDWGPACHAAGGLACVLGRRERERSKAAAGDDEDWPNDYLRRLELGGRVEQLDEAMTDLGFSSVRNVKVRRNDLAGSAAKTAAARKLLAAWIFFSRLRRDDPEWYATDFKLDAGRLKRERSRLWSAVETLYPPRDSTSPAPQSDRSLTAGGPRPAEAAASDGTPEWDRRSRTLAFGSARASRRGKIAPHRESLLEEFQQQGWPGKITPQTVPQHCIKNTVHRLNQDLEKAALPLRFSCDGTGRGVEWRPA